MSVDEMKLNNELKAMLFIARLKAITNGHDKLLDAVMPNGKRLGECTIAECGDVAEWLTRIDGGYLNIVEK